MFHMIKEYRLEENVENGEISILHVILKLLEQKVVIVIIVDVD